MNGRDLYEAYEQAMADQGCEVDPWEDLGPVDHAAWEALAGKVSWRRPL